MWSTALLEFGYRTIQRKLNRNTCICFFSWWFFILQKAKKSQNVNFLVKDYIKSNNNNVIFTYFLNLKKTIHGFYSKKHFIFAYVSEIFYKQNKVTGFHGNNHICGLSNKTTFLFFKNSTHEDKIF